MLPLPAVVQIYVLKRRDVTELMVRQVLRLRRPWVGVASWVGGRGWGHLRLL